MRGLQSGQALVLFHLLTGFAIAAVASVGSVEPERPYYIRPSPAILLTQPLDGTLSFGESINLTCKVMGMEAIISGWWPHIYWRHNSSIVNSTWPANVTVDTNYWDVTTLHSPYPGTYQCIVDDGSFILASRLATVKEGCIEECTPLQWNSNFRMVCGQGAPAYSWYKDGIPLDSSSYIVKEGGRIVVVTNETRDPFGLYTCKTSDVIRQWYLPMQAGRENATVLIDGSPSGNDITASHSGNGMTEEDITLQCNITVPGSAVNITWLHNGEQNHSLSRASVLFPRNSHVSTIAGTYVCAASTSNWEARVQFRILLKYKPNPPDSIHSSCNKEYPEVNGQELKLSWTLIWEELWNECNYKKYKKRAPTTECKQVLVISRQNHSNERYFLPMTKFVDSYSKTLRLDSEYCISLIATTKNQFERYFISQGNSTLHHCNGSVRSCQQVQHEEDDLKAPKIALISDETLYVNCGEPQSDERDHVDCTFMWQQPKEATFPLSSRRQYTEATPDFNVTCPDGSANNTSDIVFNRLVATSKVSLPALHFDCPLVCQANVCLRKDDSEDCLYSRSGSFTPRPHKLIEPAITCSTLKGESNISIEIPRDDRSRILKCLQLDTNNNNSNIRVMVFVNERMLSYTTQLNETLEIQATDVTNRSKGNITIFAMYTISAAGTSKNSTAINIPDTCPCVTGWNGSQCDEAVCTQPCLNGGTCSQPDTCTCVTGWNGSQCDEAVCNQTCMNGGTCSQPDTCTCVTGWNGSQCNEAVCNQTCLNGGTCSQPDNCTCARGWSGSTCSEVVPPQPITYEVAAYSAVTVGLPLILCSAFLSFLYYRHKRSRRTMTDHLTVKWKSECYLESTAECDAPTVYDEISSQDLSNESVTSEVKITPPSAGYIASGINNY